MRPADNPFEPGAGTPPPELVGRDLVLEDASAAIEKGAKGRPIRGQVFYGLRGVGKTVLLRAVSDIATARGGLVADLETQEDKRIADIIVPAMRTILQQLSRVEQAKSAIQNAATALQSFAAKFKIKVEGVGFEIKEPGAAAEAVDLDADLSALLVAVAQAAKRAKKFVILALDEMQYLSTPDLTALITGIHAINQKSLPLGLFGAALPQVLAKAGNARTYSERLFQFVEIGALSKPDSDRAVRVPILASKADVTQAALDLIFLKCRGYPYFLQEWGSRAWLAARTSPISERDVATAEARTIESLDKSFFRVRYDRLTQSEKEYLRAMAHLGAGPHKSGDVAKVLGKKTTQTDTVRSKVIAKGMAFAGQYGEVHFSVPLFDEFMRRELPNFKSRAPKRRPSADSKRPSPT